MTIEEWREWSRKKEEEQRGDIYSECIRRGCDRRFLQALDTRMWLFPVRQTKGFLSCINKPDAYNLDRDLRQWKIYLEVMIEKRPEEEKAKEWREALELMKSLDVKSE